MPSAPRRLRVEPVMGTVVSIDVREPFIPDTAIDEAIAWLHDVDRRFSLFRRDSEVRRLADGSLAFEDASPDVRAILTLADELRARTGGYFDAAGHRPDGRRDPTGVVKGWAVDEAATMLRLAGARNMQLAAGGDLVVVGEATPGRPWRIGIRHPYHVRDTAAILGVRDLAVATSGLYERGAHIRDPHTGEVPAELSSITVVGPTLALADAYATAAFAMGERGPAWVARQEGFGALAVTRDDRVTWTPLLDGLLVAPAPPAPEAPLTSLSAVGR
jgi:FAD:protein FMN transferase